MIRYELVCERDDGFEAWFRNSADYDQQAEAGQLSCPICGSTSVRKAPMAPAVLRRDRRAPSPAHLAEMAARVRAHIGENFDYVGERFAEEARRLHAAGDDEARPIWGEASPDDAKALIEEGVPVAPLPPALAPIPPRKVN